MYQWGCDGGIIPNGHCHGILITAVTKALVPAAEVQRLYARAEKMN